MKSLRVTIQMKATRTEQYFPVVLLIVLLTYKVCGWKHKLRLLKRKLLNSTFQYALLIECGKFFKAWTFLDFWFEWKGYKYINLITIKVGLLKVRVVPLSAQRKPCERNTRTHATVGCHVKTWRMLRVHVAVDHRARSCAFHTRLSLSKTSDSS